MDHLKKIVITGPESTGKSWLGQQLAQDLGITYVPEYAREYLEKHGPDYDFKTTTQIAKAHKRHQEAFTSKERRIILLDTDLINFKIWQELVFGKVDNWITQSIKEEYNHCYLLTYPDIPWEQDVLRENPNNRLELLDYHIAEIEKRNRPYEVIRGIGDLRLTNAKKALKKLLLI